MSALAGCLKNLHSDGIVGVIVQVTVEVTLLSMKS